MQKAAIKSKEFAPRILAARKAARKKREHERR